MDIVGDVVSLECNQEMNFDVGINCLLGESSQLSQGSRILYDNIEIEDISSDEDIDKV